jgi:hypothetical protein
MKIVKTASGKNKIKISQKEWTSIGKKAGWVKEAQWDDHGIPNYPPSHNLPEFSDEDQTQRITYTKDTTVILTPSEVEKIIGRHSNNAVVKDSEGNFYKVNGPKDKFQKGDSLTIKINGGIFSCFDPEFSKENETLEEFDTESLNGTISFNVVKYKDAHFLVDRMKNWLESSGGFFWKSDKKRPITAIY